MSAAKELKREIIDDIKAKIEKSSSVVLVEYKGINVEQDTALRAKMRAANVEYRVLKNRLVKIAFDELGIKDFDDALENTTAFAFAYGDCIAPAKIIAEAAKDVKCLKAKCGMVEGSFVTAEGIEALAKIPSKEVLLAQLLGMLQNPMSSFARAIQAVAEQKGNN